MKTAAYTGAPPAAGTYTSADVTMNAYGGISAIANGSAGIPALTHAIIPITDPTTFGSGTNPNQVTWGAALYDPASIRTNSTTLTIPSTGLWEIHFHMSLTDAAHDQQQELRVNGSIAALRRMALGVTLTTADWVFRVRLTAADVVSVYLYVGAASAPMLTPNYAGTNVISLVKLSS